MEKPVADPGGSDTTGGDCVASERPAQAESHPPTVGAGALGSPPSPFGNRRADVHQQNHRHQRRPPPSPSAAGAETQRSLSSNAAALEVPGRSRSVSKKQAKLIKHETSPGAKKLHSILADLGLQQPFPHLQQLAPGAPVQADPHKTPTTPKLARSGPTSLLSGPSATVSVRELADDVDPVNHPRKSFSVNQDTSTFSDAVSIASTSAPQENAKAGLYVFLLPLVFPPHMPASVTSINGSLVHRLTMSMTKISEKLNRKSKVYSFYNLPMVRTPPSLANSVADKPIYVNRVWNDAMHYIITFPKKYVALGSEHTINVKLIPLMKDVILKRIKFNVLERITYVSKDLRREYEYDSDDPYLMRNPADGKIRERVVHLCELKTKFRSNYTGAEPFKEEVIKYDVDDNVLKLDSSALMEDHKSSRENVQQGYTTAQKALAPDSNFRHIQILTAFKSHSEFPSQIQKIITGCITMKLSSTHHWCCLVPSVMKLPFNYQIFCSPERRGISFRTPSYSHNGVSIKPLDPEGDDRLPSFEEAISASASPVMRSFSVAEDPLSRSNSVSFAGPAPAYEDSLPGSRVDDFIPTLQIDDLVIDSNVAPVPRKPSTIKAALGNSFAATSSASNERSDNDLSYVPHTRDDRYRDEGEPASILSSDSASEAVSSNDTMSTSTSHGSSGDRLNSHDIGSVSPRTRPHHKNGCERRNESFSHGISTMPLLKNVSVEHVGDDTAQRNELARISSTDLGDPKQLGFPHAY
uniref:Arrestin C-terminal-like domain-containing protein n=1 Tax=Candidozyma auris TaxID=498019 RepID=A0A2H0ZBN0_CANAR|nr:hypothetical protein B9J08_005583 [[Candida] auris]